MVLYNVFVCFCINRKSNLKKVSLYKPPLMPFWPCPAKQQGIFLSFLLRGKTNRQMLCIKGGRKGDKYWRKHLSARYKWTRTTLPRPTPTRQFNKKLGQGPVRRYYSAVKFVLTDFLNKLQYVLSFSYAGWKLFIMKLLHWKLDFQLLWENSLTFLTNVCKCKEVGQIGWDNV